MKLVFLLSFLCFAIVYANDADEIISNEAFVEYDGKYHYHYETRSGSKAVQDGYLKKFGDSDGEAIEGRFSFVSDDGKEYGLGYVADENGYQPYGAHLPTPPPIPNAIIRALKYNQDHPYNPDNKTS